MRKVCLSVCLSYVSGAFYVVRSWTPTMVFESLGLRYVCFHLVSHLPSWAAWGGLSCKVKPKFHYTDFATLLHTQIMKVHDTKIMSLTFMVCVADFRDLCLQTLLLIFSMYCNRLNFIRMTQTGLSKTCHRLCRKHLDMVCVHDFRDLCHQLLPKLHGFMICHRLCLQLSWFVSTTFLAGKLWWKLA